jgi:hypothetical protein
MAEKITIDIGVTGLTNVKALPYSADMATVWNGIGLVDVATAVPVFIDMVEVMVNGVGSGNYVADLPTVLESPSDNDGLWISILDTGTPPSVSDPLYGYIGPSCQSTLINAVVEAISKIEINIDPCELKRALEGAIIKPTRTVIGPCVRPPLTQPLGFNLR